MRQVETAMERTMQAAHEKLAADNTRLEEGHAAQLTSRARSTVATRRLSAAIRKCSVAHANAPRPTPEALPVPALMPAHMAFARLRGSSHTAERPWRRGIDPFHTSGRRA